MEKLLRAGFAIFLLVVGVLNTRFVGAASVLNQPAQPGTLQPKPNPNVLKAPPVTDPTFDIGYIIPARNGFQPCRINWYVVSSDISHTPMLFNRSWVDHSCAHGNVTLTQTNPRASLRGKPLRFWVRRVDELSETVDIYEQNFGTENTLTFQVVFAGASLANWRSEPPADYIGRQFSNGVPLNFYVQDSTRGTNSYPNIYVDKFYSSLACRFLALPKGSLPATSVDCFKQASPMPPWTPPVFRISTPCDPQGRC